MASGASIESFERSHAFQAYLRVRDRVLAIKDLADRAASDIGQPSAYWHEELENFDYMLDASPLIIRKLRHHCSHITGLRVYDYRTSQDAQKKHFEERLRVLVDFAGGTALLVPESRELGGFGYEIDGNLYNVDTLKFFEVLIGMDRAGILEPFRDRGARRLVWEIGAGWGGFAYQLKTLFPNVTYVITDLPELFLYSAVYLAALFPQARWAIYTGDRDRAEISNWRDLDFVFMPAPFPEALPPGAPDLMVNMISFQEMTTEQVRWYVKAAAGLGCPVLYSLNRDCSPHNKELTNVRVLIDESYEVSEVPLLESGYTSAMKGGSLKPKAVGTPTSSTRESRNYRHVVGRIRR